MTYQVILKKSVEKELDSLEGKLFERIKNRLLRLEKNPRPIGVQKLHGQSAYRIRVGSYRILYLIDDAAKTVEIVAVSHRRGAYR